MSNKSRREAQRSACRLGLALLALGSAALQAPARADECVVSILNRTATIQPDGSWSINNLPIPAPGFRVRARFTCIRNGVTLRAQSPFVEIKANQTTGFEGAFTEGEFTAIPSGILLSAPIGILQHLGDTTQLMVLGTFPDGSTANLTNPDTGTMYRSSMPDVATVSAAGLVTAVKTGKTLLLAQHEGRLSTLLMTVCPAGDTDGDGLPDNVELANGLDPNNPLDAPADFDADGLTNAQEIARGTNLNDADTDDDGVNDGAEVAASTDPTSANSVSYVGTGLLASIAVTPPTVNLRTNNILPQEISRQLTVTGTLVTGQMVNLTSEGTGTTYFSNNLNVVNFGDDDGRLFAGNVGTTSVLVSNAGRMATVPVTVTAFTPVQVAAFNLPSGGFANNCDASGSYCYIADGPAGLRIVDISNPASPSVVRTVDTPGNANDVKVSGNTAFVADGSNGLVAIDITNAATAAIVGTRDTPGNANDVRPCGNRCYVADGASGLQIIDVTDRTMMTIVRTVDTPGTAFGVDCDPSRGIVVVADGPGGLHVIDVDPEPSAAIVGTVDTRPGSSEGGLDVVIAGTRAYVADGTANFSTPAGMVTVDISNAAAPVRKGTTSATGNYFDVVVDPVGLALCADNISVNAVHPFTLVDPDSPTAANSINFSGDRNGNGIDIQGGLVFMVGTVDLVHHGTFASAGTLHIARYLEIVDDGGMPPNVAITAPADGASFVVGDMITIQATATDDVAVQRVEFYVGTTLIGTDSIAPYQVVHQPLATADNLRLRARAVDYGDNSSFFDVFVDVLPNPVPMVHITSPANGATVIRGQMLPVAATAMDNTSVARVDFSSNAGFMSSDTTSPYNATVPVPTGAGVTSLMISATAVDQFGATATDSITLNVVADPLTTVIGTVVNAQAAPVSGAMLSVLGLNGTSNMDGTFSIPNVPTIAGNIQVSAMSGMLSGMSGSFSPVPGGTTNVGTITVVLVDCTYDTNFGTKNGPQSDDQTLNFNFTGGFTFPYFGVARTSITVSSNGNLQFGGSDTTFSPTLPTGVVNGIARISPFFTDLYPVTVSGDPTKGVFTRQLADKFIVTWNQVPEYSFSPPSSNSIQAVLWNTGRMDFIYNGITVLGNTGTGHLPSVAISPGGTPTLMTVNYNAQSPFNTTNNTTAIYENFNNANPFDLDFMCIRFDPRAGGGYDVRVAALSPCVPLGTLTGTVRDENGDPVAGCLVEVSLSVSGTFHQELFSGADGTFSLAGIPVPAGLSLQAYQGANVMGEGSDVLYFPNTGVDIDVRPVVSPAK